MSPKATSDEPAAKKHRKQQRSGIPGGEVFGLYQNILHIQETLKKMTHPMSDGYEKIAKTLAPKIGSRPVGQMRRPSFTLSGLQEAQIEALRLTEGRNITLKFDQQRIEKESAQGAEALWSHDTFHQHLCLLHDSVTRTEPSARTFIDAFFFRAAAILSSQSSQRKQLILGLELPVSTRIGNQKATLKGFIDYAMVLAGPELANSFLSDPTLRKIRLHSDYVLFITEAKAVDISLFHQLPQALGEMYACSEALKEKVIRGALTNGRAWLFIILKINPDGEGGTYHISREISIMAPGPSLTLEVSSSSCAWMSVVLASWIEKSFEDLNSGDWFEFEQ